MINFDERLSIAQTIADGVPMPRRIFATLAVMSAVSLAVIDGVITNIALPTICESLSISASESIWIINAYQIAIIVSLLPLSALGDVVGYRQVYIVGLAIFTLMSIGCAISWDFISLVIFRMAQGIGASCVMSINTSIVRLIYPRRMLGRGLGINSTVVSVSAVAGPTLAASIMAIADWRWLFAINLPIGLTAITLGWFFLPENPMRQSIRVLHVRDVILNVFTFGAIFAVVTSISHGLPWWIILLEGIVAIIVGSVYVKSQLNSEAPILPFDLLKIPIFSLSIITSILTFVAQMSMMVAVPFILQHQFGYTPLEVGALITAWPIVNMCTTPIAGFMVEKYHPGVLGCIGLVIFSLGLILVTMIPDEPSKWDFVWRFAICGLGFGFFQAPNNSIIIASAPLTRSGSASGMMATARLTGQTLGAAVVAMLFYVVPTQSLIHILYVGAAFAIIAMILAFSRLGLPIPESLSRR